MDIRKARIKAREIVNGGVYPFLCRSEILDALRKPPRDAKPLTIKEDKKLLLEFEKKTCPAHAYEFHEWYKDRWGCWDTNFQCLIFLEGIMYVREARSPVHKELIEKEFEKLAWVGITITKDKGKILQDGSLERMAEFYVDHFKILMETDNGN